MTMHAPIKTLWINALLSDEYKQGTGYLHDIAEDTHCCLGVLCDLAEQAGVVSSKPHQTPDGLTVTRFVGKSWQDGSTERLPKAVQQWAGLPNHDPALEWTNVYGDLAADEISELNDTYTHDFAELAKLIEENL